MGITLSEFNEYRNKMNERLLSAENNKTYKRIINADTNAYLEGALPVKTKDRLGLVASMVLRCDDCVRYHLIKCYENGMNEAELMEVMGISNLVGGSIVIPHTRRAIEYWDELNK